MSHKCPTHLSQKCPTHLSQKCPTLLSHKCLIPISHYTFYVCVKFSPNEHQCASSVGAPHLTDNPRIDLGGSKLSGLTFFLAHQVTFMFCTEVLTNGVCPCCAMLCSDISCILASPLLLYHQAINTIALLPISVVKGKGNVVQHFYLINKAC